MLPQLVDLLPRDSTKPGCSAQLEVCPRAWQRHPRPLVSGAPSRLAVSATADPCIAAAGIGGVCTPTQHSNAEAAAATPPREQSRGAAAGAVDGRTAPWQAPDIPSALPAGVTVRRRRGAATGRSRRAPAVVLAQATPAHVPIRHSSETNCQPSPTAVAGFGTPHSQRHIPPAICGTADQMAARRATLAGRRSSVAARAPSARLHLQLPAPARRASLVPSATVQPREPPARSRQSISFFHRECAASGADPPAPAFSGVLTCR